MNKERAHAALKLLAAQKEKAALAKDKARSAGSCTTDQPPAILNFRAINNGNNSRTFTGQVQDEYATGLATGDGGVHRWAERDGSSVR
jgi:hypothetical protein